MTMVYSELYLLPNIILFSYHLFLKFFFSCITVYIILVKEEITRNADLDKHSSSSSKTTKKKKKVMIKLKSQRFVETF